jgi:hypothetical protein
MAFRRLETRVAYGHIGLWAHWLKHVGTLSTPSLYLYSNGTIVYYNRCQCVVTNGPIFDVASLRLSFQPYYVFVCSEILMCHAQHISHCNTSQL